jgi:hypothetical protein
MFTGSVNGMYLVSGQFKRFTNGSLLKYKNNKYFLVTERTATQIPSIVGPANQNGCITLCVGNLADEKF